MRKSREKIARPKAEIIIVQRKLHTAPASLLQDRKRHAERCRRSGIYTVVSPTAIDSVRVVVVAVASVVVVRATRAYSRCVAANIWSDLEWWSDLKMTLMTKKTTTKTTIDDDDERR
jgi:hypothetical protein